MSENCLEPGHGAFITAINPVLVIIRVFNKPQKRVLFQLS